MPDIDVPVMGCIMAGMDGMGWPFCDELGAESPPPAPLTDVMSWMELRLLSFLFKELSLMKYFCAWDATCVGVLEMTKLREMERQSPLPNLARPRRNRRCSSSVHGMPLRRSWSLVFAAGALPPFFLEDLLLPFEPPEVVCCAGAGAAGTAVSTFTGATTPSVFKTPSWFS